MCSQVVRLSGCCLLGRQCLQDHQLHGGWGGAAIQGIEELGGAVLGEALRGAGALAGVGGDIFDNFAADTKAMLNSAGRVLSAVEEEFEEFEMQALNLGNALRNGGAQEAGAEAALQLTICT